MTDRHEWQRDAAVWLAGRRIEAELPLDAPGGDRRLARALAAFRAWQAAAKLETEAAVFAQRVRSRLAARGPGVRRIDRAPDPLPPQGSGSLASMVAAARRIHAAPLAELGVAAGSGRELFDEPCEAWVALPAELPPSRYLALRVVGDSMLPLLHSGDVVLVDLDARVRPGAIAVARHPEHGYVVKRVTRARGRGGAEEGTLSLVSLNPAYPAMPFEPGRGTLLGRVVLRWCAHGSAKPRLAPGP
jgi:SOS-response transcriptional repressor LexA